MNILYTNFHRGDGGGHTTYIRSLARGLAQRHHVCVAATPGSRLNREARNLANVTVLDQPFPSGPQKIPAWSQAWRQLRGFIQAHNIDIVHVNGSADHRLTMRALRGVSPRPAIVFTQHNTKPLDTLGKRWRARFGTDAVIAVCDYSRRQLEASPYRNCKLATVHNGIDLDHFQPLDDAQAAQARQNWADANTLLIGSNAGTDQHKGWMDLVEALATLPQALRSQITIVLAGKPVASDLHEQIDKLGLKEQVCFTGILDDVRPMLAAIDVGFVLSHDIETISFACREMMAMGKPVLCSDAGGLPENIEPNVDGWVVPAGNRQDIAAALRGIIEQRNKLIKMGRAARRHAEAAFGLERFVSSTETTYRELLAGWTS